MEGAVDPEGLFLNAGDLESAGLIKLKCFQVADFHIHQRMADLPAIEELLLRFMEKGFAEALSARPGIDIKAVDQAVDPVLPLTLFQSGDAGQLLLPPAAEHQGFAAALIAEKLTSVVSGTFGQFGGGGGAEIMGAFLQGTVAEGHKSGCIRGTQGAADRGAGDTGCVKHKYIE